MSAKVFLDTNVLLYAYDRSEPTKQVQALAVLDTLASRGGVISTQVLSEFFSVSTRKMTMGLTADEAADRVAHFLRSFVVVDLTPLVVLEAVRGVREHKLNYWDALIWASARLNQVAVVFSEDFSSNVVFEGVHVVNPFAPDFELAKWV